MTQREWMKAARGSVSIRRAAVRCGWGRGVWEKRESGRTPLRVNEAKTIAERFGVSTDSLDTEAPKSDEEQQEKPGDPGKEAGPKRRGEGRRRMDKAPPSTIQADVLAAMVLYLVGQQASINAQLEELRRAHDPSSEAGTERPGPSGAPPA